jgi:Mrp family chromosome partitioning ATPase
MTASGAVVHAFDGIAGRVDALGLRTIGFTSAVLGEGVSTVAIGTALALAALRQESVLLIDGNWLQPSLTADAHLKSVAGLAECLTRSAVVETVAQRRVGSRLHFLPIGDVATARPTLRMLSSFLANQIPASTTVVVDLPPALAGESLVLPWAALLDQIFVIVREAATPYPLVRQALATVGLAAQAQVVINRAIGSSAAQPAGMLAART